MTGDGDGEREKAAQGVVACDQRVLSAELNTVEPRRSVDLGEVAALPCCFDSIFWLPRGGTSAIRCGVTPSKSSSSQPLLISSSHPSFSFLPPSLFPSSAL